MSQPLPPNAHCGRCGGEFRCGVSDEAPCACSKLVLPPALLAQLQRQYAGCLCLACLQTLAEPAPAALPPLPPLP